jgi:hypothetical protein
MTSPAGRIAAPVCILMSVASAGEAKQKRKEKQTAIRLQVQQHLNIDPRIVYRI